MFRQLSVPVPLAPDTATAGPQAISGRKAAALTKPRTGQLSLKFGMAGNGMKQDRSHGSDGCGAPDKHHINRPDHETAAHFQQSLCLSSPPCLCPPLSHPSDLVQGVAMSTSAVMPLPLNKHRHTSLLKNIKTNRERERERESTTNISLIMVLPSRSFLKHSSSKHS